ncbi:FG-GAP repeat domain-containing protein [Roseovarius arcticus]|uniref:FG-GAP repeat domain-containing protein n=1 Tax=Roseovarius arcticus TaxID=2547404 RepID=UPI001FE46E0E|nr:VCBS repeat-containing protein [Roseovarius arcticus]
MRLLRPYVRRARLALCLWLVSLAPASADNAARSCVADWNSIGEVCLIHSPDGAQYGHDVLGATPEWHILSVMSSDPLHTVTAIRQPGHIFEDIAPRLADVTGDGIPEIIVVQSSMDRGARLAVFRSAGGTLSLLAATPYIGQRNRWLAPVAVGDLDGDGAVELAYIDRPHLTKRLRVWRYANGALGHVADLGNLTNHRIGWNFIAGGWRPCASEMILASGDWSRVMAVRLEGGSLTARDVGTYRAPGSLTAAMACPP